MASIRRLPSGKYQAAVSHKGKRITRTDPLRSVVRTWAAQTEADLARGAWRDPRNVKALTVGEWYGKWVVGRIVEPETATNNAGDWSRHLEPTFGPLPLDDVTRSTVAGWVRAKHESKAGAGAIRRAFALLRVIFEGAVLEGLLQSNPARSVALPPTPRHAPRWWTPAEAEAIVAELREPHATMTLTMLWVGLRWGEAAALTPSDINFLRGRLTVSHTLTQAGRPKPYPKTSTSMREVPVPRHVLEALARSCEGVPRQGRIFVASNGSPLSGGNWRKVFDGAIERAGAPRYTPHACRHTAASWLVQAGVPLYEVRAMLGHSSISTTQLYAHLAPDANAAVLGAWEKLRAHEVRTVADAGL